MDLRAALGESARLREELATLSQRHDGERSNLVHDRSQLQAQLRALQEELAALQRKHESELQHMAAEELGRLQDVRREYACLEQQLQAEQERADAAVTRASAELRECQKALAAAEQQARDALQEALRSATQASTFQSQLLTLRQQLQRQHENAPAPKEPGVPGAGTKGPTNVADAATNTDTAQPEFGAELARLQQQIAALERQRAALQSELERTQPKLAAMEARHTAAARQVSLLTAELKSREDGHAQAQQLLEEVVAQRVAQQADADARLVCEMREQLYDCQARLTQSELAAEQAAAALQKSRAELDAARGQLHQLQQERQQHKLIRNQSHDQECQTDGHWPTGRPHFADRGQCSRRNSPGHDRRAGGGDAPHDGASQPDAGQDDQDDARKQLALQAEVTALRCRAAEAEALAAARTERVADLRAQEQQLEADCAALQRQAEEGVRQLQDVITQCRSSAGELFSTLDSDCARLRSTRVSLLADVEAARGLLTDCTAALRIAKAALQARDSLDSALAGLTSAAAGAEGGGSVGLKALHHVKVVFGCLTELCGRAESLAVSLAPLLTRLEAAAAKRCEPGEQASNARSQAAGHTAAAGELQCGFERLWCCIDEHLAGLARLVAQPGLPQAEPHPQCHTVTAKPEDQMPPADSRDSSGGSAAGGNQQSASALGHDAEVLRAPPGVAKVAEAGPSRLALQGAAVGYQKEHEKGRLSTQAKGSSYGGAALPAAANRRHVASSEGGASRQPGRMSEAAAAVRSSASDASASAQEAAPVNPERRRLEARLQQVLQLAKDLQTRDRSAPMGVA
ncbi:hypothetical protein GPECTOR_1g53 [Gonium pectorale]|uniref:Uncharacterized protein n=1 Tax=Gonium pectorale TaxID=33097 RepID=A0A150H341_GONPE|nr:hypothetical protein GPECTOR_1g53 [Gonium pectorale]|eukprot:KXZ56589.1 hypothetical protein GPECTOR_1g53 [Gonium pectorale]